MPGLYRADELPFLPLVATRVEQDAWQGLLRLVFELIHTDKVFTAHLDKRSGTVVVRREDLAFATDKKRATGLLCTSLLGTNLREFPRWELRDNFFGWQVAAVVPVEFGGDQTFACREFEHQA